MRIGLASFRNAGADHFGTTGICASLALSVIVVAGIAAWLMLPEPSDAGDDEGSSSSAIVVTTQNAQTPAQTSEAQSAQAAAIPSRSVATAPPGEPATVGVATAPQTTQEAKPSEPAAQKSPLDGLRIASQSFRRGGLGSKALVTLTLRNANDFAVKDVEIACAFIRRDGSPLTERTRVIPGTIAMRSRKTYSHMLIGFININASKAKCSVVTASRL